MTLTEKLLRQLDNPNLTISERAMLRCQAATELEHRGQYEAASASLGGLWQGIGERPSLEGLDKRTRAEVLLCVGVLSGSLGSVNQIREAQEAAKNLISESMALFEALGDDAGAANAQSALGVCYWRAGAHDDARIFLEQAFSRLDEKTNIEQKAKALVRLTLVEISTNRFHDALRILTDAARIFEESNNDALKGRFHGQLALVMRRIGTSEHRPDYIDSAIIEYTAASHHHKQAGHTSYHARDENNLGFLLYSLGRYEEAHEHLDYARRLFTKLNDKGSIAQVDETRTRVLLAQGRLEEAERVIRESVSVLERGGQQSLLAESLITQGVVLARLGHHAESGDALRRAMEVAETAGALEDGGVAALTLLEEHGERMTDDERREIYLRADGWLKRTQDASHAARLRDCARRMVEAGDGGGAAMLPAERAVPLAGSVESAVPVATEVDSVERVESVERAAESTTAAGDERRRSLSMPRRARARWSRWRASLPRPACPCSSVARRASARRRWRVPFMRGAGAAARLSASTGRAMLTSAMMRGRAKRSCSGTAQQASTKPHSIRRVADYAVADYAEAVRRARGGTLYVAEVGGLGWVAQGRLLRLLERGEVAAMGTAATPAERVAVRVVAGTRGELGTLVARGKFRKELFYRFEAFEIRLAALRTRPADIAALAHHFVAEAGAREGRRLSVSAGAVAELQRLGLAGNARELRTLHGACGAAGEGGGDRRGDAGDGVAPPDGAGDGGGAVGGIFVAG